MKNLKYLLTLTLTTFLVFGTSLRYGFSQDDWYFLLISRADSLADVLGFFNPATQSGFPFFRPLGTQLYYYLATQFGGLGTAPLLMHIFMLLIQISSAFLVYQLLLKLGKPRPLSQAVGLVYASAGSLFLSLYYIAATQQLLATFLSLLALNATLSRRHTAAGIAWALSLLSKETAIMTPVLMLLLLYFVAGIKRLPELFRRSLPYLLVGSTYLFLRFSAPLTLQSEYHFVFGSNVISTLRWFFLFGYGAPEDWIRYATAGGGINLLAFVRDYGFWAALNALLTLTLSLGTVITLIIKRKILAPYLYLVWFVLGLLPILFLQNHRYPHYLDLSLIPLILLLLEFNPKSQKLLTFCLVLSSFSSVLLSTRLHWTTARAEISERSVAHFAQANLCHTDHLIFAAPAPYPAELSYALSLENGPRVICNNPSLRVEYTSEAQADHRGLIYDPRLILNPEK